MVGLGAYVWGFMYKRAEDSALLRSGLLERMIIQI